MSKKVVAVIFGGVSPEHEVSKVSATNIISSLSPDKYYVMPIYITRDGKWLLYDGPVDNIVNGNWEKYATSAILSPDTSHRGLLRIVGDRIKNIPIDVVFPVLHGEKGEDGAIQGLFELCGIDYVGCGVLSSAVSMNKAFTKIIADSIGIEQARYVIGNKFDLEKTTGPFVKKVEAALGYPCFVKPACTGSSVGISKAHDRNELKKAIALALEYDKTILVEEAIIGRELECAVLGNNDPVASGIGEILAAAEFYDYDAKYNNSDSKTIINPDIPKRKAEEIRKAAVKIFKALDGRGLSRVDFFLEEGTNRVIFNEINTLPGFTAISMYPMLFNEAGISKPELVDRLIALASEGK